MRTHRKAAPFIFVALLFAPLSQAVPQDRDNDRGGIRTETQERMRGGFDYNLLWNAFGLLGVLGLLGLRRGHEEDSYHPASFE